jgi:hypothetical protein
MESVPKDTTGMFILDYVIYRIVAVIFIVYFVSAEKNIFHIKFFQLFILVHYFKQQITTMWVSTL